MTELRDQLKSIRTFPSLVKFLRDELDWPIDSTDDFEELTFDYTPEELGIDAASAAKIEEIKRLRPLAANQPWGIFFVKFEPKQLPVVALRRILNRVVVKKRATGTAAEQQKWATDDLLFISAYGDDDERRINFAHFSQDPSEGTLPTLKVLAWDERDTGLHLDDVARRLVEHLSWPDEPDEWDDETWRERWSSAFELKHREVVTTSRELALELADLARAVRERINAVLEIESESGPVTRLMEAFREALVHDLEPDDFADMYAQTIAYGLLSARIANPTGEKSAERLPVTNPFLKELMATFLHIGDGERGGTNGIDFDELGVSEVVELLDRANMEAVVRDFGDANPLEDPVIHFYELFLKEYDAKKRMQRGVFYTPRPVVSYIVRSVHELLRSEFGLEDGLADAATWGEVADRLGVAIPDGVDRDDRFVTILDPATGTGTFLVEAIEVIHRTLVAKWTREERVDEIHDLWNEYVPTQLLPRLHGYELMMAPYAIAHLKIGLKLFESGYRFHSDERARVFLANALEPASDVGQLQLEGLIPALAHEAEVVNEVKGHQRFTVVIGNPPYSGHSVNNQIAWIVDKVYDYKRGYPELQKPGQAKWLQDDYVKFLRFAECKIEESGVGGVGFITNHAWLDNPTFKGMRSHFVSTFPRLRVIDLHGNANKKEKAPDGTSDENVFEIKQGVAISLLSRVPDAEPRVERGDLFGPEAVKREALLAGAISMTMFTPLHPELVFAPIDADRKAEYEVFVSLPTLMDQNGDPAIGIVTTHDEFAISFTREEQIQKVEALLATSSEVEARASFRLCSQSQWNYANAKSSLRSGEWRDQLVPVLYRPFDLRWTVFNRHVAVHGRERVSRHLIREGNIAVITTRQTKDRFSALVCSTICAHKSASRFDGSYVFPLWLDPGVSGAPRAANLSGGILSRFGQMVGFDVVETSIDADLGAGCGGRGDLRSSIGPRDVFDYVYAVLHAPGYRGRYAEFLKAEFPRIPLTTNTELFSALVRLGADLVALHLLREDRLARNSVSYKGAREPVVERVGWMENVVWLDAGATSGTRANRAGACGFVGVTEDVWSFDVGGYQVCHKWLKDRQGRTLSEDDIAHYEKIVVAISETIRLMAEIDEAIEEHGGWPDAFVTSVERNT